MERNEVQIGMKVRRTYTLHNFDGSETITVKPAIYTVTGINEYGDIEFTVKGGKQWACHPSYLVPHTA